MKHLLGLFLGISFLSLNSCREEKRYHDEKPSSIVVDADDTIKEILQFQQDLNESFKDPEVSPLPDRYRKDFRGLDFFDPDTSFRVMAYLERTPESLPFLMPTTTDRKALERVYGIVYFNIGQKEHRLEVYQNLDLLDQEGYEDYLFLPFTDKTNGESTYAGGRYIDLDIPEGDSLLIDFNKSYNPYCVYNKKYSCPIVPEVNHLNTEIKAGIKDFKTKEP